MEVVKKVKKSKRITVKEFAKHVSAAAVLQEYVRMVKLVEDSEEGQDVSEHLKTIGRLKMSYWWITGDCHRDYYAGLKKKKEKLNDD
jgi:hypothetical protein